MPRWQVAAAALATALAAGCGSTVSGPTSSVGLPSEGLAAPGSGAPTAGSEPGMSAAGGSVQGGSGTVGASGSGISGGAATASGSGAATGGGATGQTTGRRGTATTPATGPGITASSMYVGVEYSNDEGAGDKAVGAAGAAPSYDTRNVFNAVISYANSHGGFAGRKLVPVYHNISVTQDRSVSDAAACADFTQDHKVFAMEGDTDELRACAEKAGAVSLIGGGEVASTFQKYPHFVDENSIRLDRLGPVTVNGLYRAHYFAGKLGLVTWDDPNYRYAMTHGFLPTLASHGIQPAAPVAYVTVPQQVGAVTDMSAQMSNVVTKFRSLGIDHVIIQDGPAGIWAGEGLTLEFMNQAKSQHYYPRYGENSNNIPGWSALPSDEQDKLLAVMGLDYSAKYDAGWHNNPDREKCFQIEAKAGLPVSSSNDNDEVTAAQACDMVFFLQLMVNRLSTITSDSFIQGVAALGTRFGSALTYGTRFFPGRRDGGDKVRTAEYFQSCQCLKYQGAPYQPD